MRGVLAAAVVFTACGEPVVGFPLAQGGGQGGGTGCSDIGLDSDSHNCGACGHDCLGGACDKGVCQPVTLATGMTNPVSVTLDPANVYFVESTASGTVRACPKTGCPGTPELLAENQPFPTGIACQAGQLAWANTGQGPAFSDGAVKTCSAASCTVQTTAMMQPGATAVAIDGQLLFFVQLLDPGILSTCSINDCLNPTPLLTGLVYPSALALDAEDVFVASYGTGAADGAITRCSRMGCAGMPVTIATGQVAVSGIAVDASNVYWTSQGDAQGMKPGAVLYCPKSGCGTGGAQLLADNRPSPYSIAVDNGQLYWTERGTTTDLRDGAILRCTTAGCKVGGPDVLAVSQLDPHGLALDGTAIYWGSYGPDATVKKLAR